MQRELTSIAAVMEEERDTSQLRLILCGSVVGQMESLLAERSPLHGRLRPLHLLPVPFEQARQFLPGLSPACCRLWRQATSRAARIAALLRSDAQRASKHLNALVDMRLVERKLPIGAEPTARTGHWHLRDPFLRFWFRFVFPYQDDLENGLPATTLYRQTIVLLSRGGYTEGLKATARARDDLVLVDVNDALSGGSAHLPDTVEGPSPRR